MRIRVLSIAAVGMLSGCTHGAISSIPMQIEGVGTVYRYEGRANFAHQLAEADRMIIEHCKAVIGGRPIVVNVQKRDLGVVVLGGGQSTTMINATAVGTSNITNVAGTATTHSSGTATGLRNYNQEVYFKCVTE